jgi:HPt (histidine-containing phosphotransfer) domain-containing protein
MGSNDPETERAVERLCRVGGPELAGRVIQLFLDTTPLRLAAIAEGQTRDDFELIERLAHSLGSSAGNVGLESVRELAGQIEYLARQRKQQTIACLLGRIEAAYAEARAGLDELRRKL